MPRKVITFSVPTEHAKLILDAAERSDEPNLGAWVAKRITRAAAEDLGVPVPAEPAPAMPTRDKLRLAAKAFGLDEESFKARVLAEAVSFALKPDTMPPPAMTEGEPVVAGGAGGGELQHLAKTKSKSDLLRSMTPAQAFKAVRH